MRPSRCGPDMCLAVPARIVEVLGADQAVIDLGGVRQRISLALVEGARVGDYVIVHVGHALGLLDEDEARETLALLAQVGAP